MPVRFQSLQPELAVAGIVLQKDATMKTVKIVPLMITFAVLVSLVLTVDLSQATDTWACSRTTLGDAMATFYGGSDASGTYGGSCGYGNPYQTGYGVQTGALSSVLYNNGLSCGACFELKCKRTASAYAMKWCYANAAPIRITATNHCPPAGVCAPPRIHFDLAFPAFTRMANWVAGIIPVQYRRVACQRSGGIKFTLNGNPYWNLVLVTNVGGCGNVAQLSIKGSSTGWYPMRQNWGQNWEAFVKLTNQKLCFQVTTGMGRSMTVYDVAPSYWKFGQTYQTSSNFYAL